jgi:hypothetical protein
VSLSALIAAAGGAAGTLIGGPGVGAAVATGLHAATSGGGTPAGPCPGSPTVEQVDAVRRMASPSELAPVVSHWDGRTDAGRKPGQFLTASASEIVGWLMGGHDCRHGDPNGVAVQNRFIDLVRKYSDAGALPVVQPQLTPGAQVGQTIGGIVQGGQQYVTGVVGGAVSGATVAAQAGGAASQGAQQLTQLLPIVAVLGLAAVIILRK